MNSFRKRTFVWLALWALESQVKLPQAQSQESGLRPTPAVASQSTSVQFSPPKYTVLRTSQRLQIDGKLDEPAWFAAPLMTKFQFPWFQQGKPEQSSVKLLWDDQNLYLAHVCQDEFITARYTERDGPISQDDCFEIMLAPNIDRPNFYFNIEWNALGGFLDNHRPEGAKGRRVPWNADGVLVAGTIVGSANNHADHDVSWTCEVAIPLSNFAKFAKHPIPRADDQWRVNFNRHGGERNVQYSQWSPGDTPQPSFHTPHRFGTLIFSNDMCPF